MVMTSPIYEIDNPETRGFPFGSDAVVHVMKSPVVSAWTFKADDVGRRGLRVHFFKFLYERVNRYIIFGALITDSMKKIIG